jgi:hypothetical protein
MGGGGMTTDEIQMAKALNQCTFVPGIGTKRFARNMAALAEHNPGAELTEKQKAYLCEAVIRFRRQIAPEIVLLARMQGAGA